MSDVLAFAEQRDGQILGVSREVVTVAAGVAEGLGGRADVLALGAPGLAGEALSLSDYGAGRIRVAEDEALASYSGEGYAGVVAAAIEGRDYAAALFPATAQGKDLAPRVAALADLPLATDVTGVEVVGGGLRITRPVYAGRAFARLTIDAAPVLLSIRPNAFAPAEREGCPEVEILAPELSPGDWKSRVVGFEKSAGGQLDVAEASIIVSGGRGMRDPSNWGILEDLRDALGPKAALGASRAVVDAGWRPHGEQVGQTGKTVAPTLYVAIGISGAIQHLAGMRTSQVIVAVNKDPDAPIFGVADYGVVGDLFEVAPRLAEEIRALRS